MALAIVIGTKIKSLARVFAVLANSLFKLGKWSFWSLGYEGSLLAQGKVCGLQAGCGRSGNYRRCGLKLDKKEPAILSFSLQE